MSADDSFEAKVARIVAGAPELTTAQSALITRFSRRNVQAKPLKDAGAAEPTTHHSPGRAA